MVRKNQHRLFMQDPDKTSSYLKAADTKPSLLLRGETPRLLDEWQMAPVLWDAVRFAVDMRGKSGQFILTGSAVPQDDAVQHTGTGRISRMTMRPMSLYESLESNGSVSLKNLFDGSNEIEGFSDLDIEHLAFAIVRGGWPASIGENKSIACRYAVDYTEAVINADISRVDGIERSPVRVRALMHSLARNISTLATLKTIRDDIAIGDDESLSDKKPQTLYWMISIISVFCLNLSVIAICAYMQMQLMGRYFIIVTGMVWKRMLSSFCATGAGAP